MTIALALEYIPRRMKELGFNNDYIIRFRHFTLQPNEKVNIDADNQYFILLDGTSLASISSDMAIYNLSDTAVTEHGYEHQGAIKLYNYSEHLCHLKFIQLVPINKRK